MIFDIALIQLVVSPIETCCFLLALSDHSVDFEDELLIAAARNSVYVLWDTLIRKVAYVWA